MRLYLGILLICLVSCQSQPVSSLPFALKGPHTEEFRRALADWNDCQEVILFESPSGIPVTFDGPEIVWRKAAAGITRYSPDRIDYTDNRDITTTIEHEIGHILMGPDHYGSGLMRATLLNQERVSPEDCQRLKEHMGYRRSDPCYPAVRCGSENDCPELMICNAQCCLEAP